MLYTYTYTRTCWRNHCVGACALTLLCREVGYLINILAGVPWIWHAKGEVDVKVLQAKVSEKVSLDHGEVSDLLCSHHKLNPGNTVNSKDIYDPFVPCQHTCVSVCYWHVCHFAPSKEVQVGAGCSNNLQLAQGHSKVHCCVFVFFPPLSDTNAPLALYAMVAIILCSLHWWCLSISAFTDVHNCI